MLNAVGGVHYQGRHMKKVQQVVFDEVIEFVQSGSFEYAEDAAARFPFAADFMELASVTPMEELED